MQGFHAGLQRNAAELARFAVFVAKRFMSDGIGRTASALSYTSLLAIVPLIVIAFSIFAAFPAFEGAREQIEQLVFESMIPEIGGQIRGHLLSFADNASKLTVVGIIALAVSAILLLNTIEDAFNRIWKSDRKRPVLLRVLIYWALLTIGPVLMSVGITLTTGTVDFVQDLANSVADDVGIVVGTFDNRTWYVDRTLSIILQALGFAVLFKLVPNRPSLWGDAIKGGIVASILFELLKRGFVFYLSNFPTYQTVYGAMAVIPIFLIWLYLSWMMVLAGAETAAALPEWRIHRADRPGKDTPQMRLIVAISLLRSLADQARNGGWISIEALMNRTESPLADNVFMKLREAEYVVCSEENEAVLAKDLSQTSLYNLVQVLGDGAGDLNSENQSLDVVLRNWNSSERDALSGTVKSVIEA